MSTSISTSSLQTSSAKHFLLGIVFGVGFNSVVGWLVTVTFSFLGAMFWDAFYDNATIFALLSTLIRLSLFVGSLVVAQKTFKNKFATIGMASGFVISMALIAMQSALMVGR